MAAKPSGALLALGGGVGVKVGIAIAIGIDSEF
jgi:hypothetical protein